MKTMKNVGILFCAITLFAASCAKKQEEDANDEEKLTITVAHNQTSQENPYAYGVNKFKEIAEAKSKGALSVIVHHGTLGENENELVEKLGMGAVDIVTVSPGFLVNVAPGFMAAISVPEVDMFSMPYLFENFEHWNAALDGEFGETMRRLITEKTGGRFIILGFWTASVRDYYGKKKVIKPSDLQGMTLRGQSAQVQQDFWKACGAIPTSIAWDELYQALQQGVVDSAENDYTNFMLKEHHKTPNGRYISETHHDFTTRFFLASARFWNKLSKQQRLWVREATQAATEEERAVTVRMAEQSKAKVIADGAIVTGFDKVDIDAFKALAIPLQDSFAQKNGISDLLEMVRKAK